MSKMTPREFLEVCEDIESGDTDFVHIKREITKESITYYTNVLKTWNGDVDELDVLTDEECVDVAVLMIVIDVLNKTTI